MSIKTIFEIILNVHRLYIIIMHHIVTHIKADENELNKLKV